MSTQAMMTIVVCVCISSLVLALSSFFADSRLPRSVPFIYLAIALVLIGSPRLLVRSLVTYLTRQDNVNKEAVKIGRASCREGSERSSEAVAYKNKWQSIVSLLSG